MVPERVQALGAVPGLLVLALVLVAPVAVAGGPVEGLYPAGAGLEPVVVATAAATTPCWSPFPWGRNARRDPARWPGKSFGSDDAEAASIEPPDLHGLLGTASQSETSRSFF